MSITEILQRHAAALHAAQDNLTAADHLEAAAKKLRQEAARKPVKSDFKEEIRKSKEARLARFAKVTKDDALSTADRLLTAAGWKKGASDPGGAVTYVQPNSPGVKIEITGNSFTVSQGKNIVQKKTSLDQLAEYLKQSGTSAPAPAKGTDPAMSKQVTKDLPIPATAKVNASKASMAARLKEIKKQFQS